MTDALPDGGGAEPVAEESRRNAGTRVTGPSFSQESDGVGRGGAKSRLFGDLAQEASDRAAQVRLQVGAHAADAYLNVLAAQEKVRVAAEDVAKWQGLAALVDTLVAAARLGAGVAARQLILAQGTLAEAAEQAAPGAARPPGACNCPHLGGCPFDNE